MTSLRAIRCFRLRALVPVLLSLSISGCGGKSAADKAPKDDGKGEAKPAAKQTSKSTGDAGPQAKKQLSSANGSATARKVSTRYVPADAIAAIALDGVQLLKAPELELMPWEVLQVTGQQQFGIDPLAIDQVVAFFAPPMGGPFVEMGAVVHFKKAQQLGEAFLKNVEKSKLGDTTIYQVPGTPIQMAQGDPQTLLISIGGMLPKMMGTKNAKSLLISLLSEARTTAPLTAFVAFEPLRPMAKQMIAGAPLPPAMQKFTALADHLSSIELHVALAGDGRLVLTGNDGAAAEAIEKLVIDGLALGKQTVLELVTDSIPAENEAMNEAMQKYMVRLTNNIEAMLKPVRKDAQVTISIKSTVAMPGVMVAMLLPAVQAAREAARKMSASNDLKEIGLAMFTYHDQYNKLPGAANYDKDGKPLLSWRVHLLPYFSEEELYNEFHLDEPWDSEHNKKLIARMPEIYRNQNLPFNDRTNYLAVTGEGTAFPGNKVVKFRDFVDGQSVAMLVVEADAERAVIWTKPADFPFNKDKPAAGLGGLRQGGFQCLLGDGATMFMPNSVAAETLHRLMLLSDGKPVELPR